jgi:sugar phosphate isomerase/epimerase
MSIQIGIKLDLGFAERDDYRLLFDRRDVLAYLRQLGLEAVETPISPSTPDGALTEHVCQCAEAGLRVSLHPYTEGTPHNPAFFSLTEGNLCRRAHERFFALAAETAQIQGDTTIINLHSAAAVENTREDLLDRSIEFFRWSREWCENHAPGARVVAELQIAPITGAAVRRIGDSYSELMSVLRRVEVDACWDFGHAFMNTRRFGQPLDPPNEFLPRVAHVHCHDVDDEDHQPLIFGNVPWDRFLEMLVDHGFDETVILEVPASHFLAKGGLDALTRSVVALRQVVPASGADMSSRSRPPAYRAIRQSKVPRANAE